MASVLSAPRFYNEEAAYKYLEARIWPHGPTCPHGGGFDRISKMQGESTRIGCYKCYQCRKNFTVEVGTVFESSHVKLHIWLQAVALLTTSKKGISGLSGKRAVVSLVECNGKARSFYAPQDQSTLGARCFDKKSA